MVRKNLAVSRYPGLWLRLAPSEARMCLEAVARRHPTGANVDDRVVLDAMVLQSIGVVERLTAILQVNLVDWDIIHVCCACQRRVG